jgi:hypothetical protein
MHFLHQEGRSPKSEILAYFGRRALESIERLQRAEMIRRVGCHWLPYALRRCFAASKIIAVEAKVGKWTEAVNQALLNTWFASKSYVLVASPPSPSQIAEARDLGIGVCSLGHGRVQEVASRTTRLPRSYASWVLGESAWRSLRAFQDPMV